MNHHYNIINQCLQLLEASDLPKIEKEHVGTRLIEMKRLLLKNSLAEEKNGSGCGGDVLLGLLCRMQKVCAGGCEAPVFDELVIGIDEVMTVLGGERTGDKRAGVLPIS